MIIVDYETVVAVYMVFYRDNSGTNDGLAVTFRVFSETSPPTRLLF